MYSVGRAVASGTAVGGGGAATHAVGCILIHLVHTDGIPVRIVLGGPTLCKLEIQCGGGFVVQQHIIFGHGHSNTRGIGAGFRLTERRVGFQHGCERGTAFEEETA